MSSTSSEDKEKSGYMSWVSKRQRPDKLPGLQDVWRLPEMPEGQTCCGEGEKCFYFSCSKCASKLALDSLNPGYETSMQYVPRISCIPWPEPFKEDNKYHGEIYEMYLKYFSQMNPPMKGVAINGWGSTNAANLFHNTANTFKGTKKFKKSKDFEIDWILFNGSSITVIEVKEKSETAKGKKKNFEAKIDQIKKDRVIMQHLMEVTGTEKTRINYVIACPNVSITEVTDGNFLRNHCQFLQDIVNAGDTISFLSEECFTHRHVYKYNQYSKELECKDFEILIKESPTDRNNTADPVINLEWDERYKHLSATLILSILIIGNVIDDENQHLYPRSDDFELKQRCSRKLQGIPCEARNNFPECLVLGPDQLDVIREITQSKRRWFFIFGEAGCGKSFVLLYLLYQYTAKNLSESHLKKVVFIIPEEKTEFRKFVKTFVDNYCHSHLVDIYDIWEVLENKVLQYEWSFFDEHYDYSMVTNLSPVLLPQSINKYVCVIGLSSDGQVKLDEDNLMNRYSILVDNCKLFCLRKRYRNPANIAMRCSKIYEEKRSFKLFENIHDYLIFTCLSDSGVSVAEENAFKLLKYDRTEIIFNYLDEISHEMFSGENVLLVTNMSTICSSSFAGKKCTHVEFREELTKLSYMTRELRFTGVQYHTVVLVFNRRSFSEPFDTSLLYQAISRATYRVILICHEKNFDYFYKLLIHVQADRQVLHQLRESKDVPMEDFQLLTDKLEWEIALDIVILTKNIGMFEKIKNLVIKQIGSKNVLGALIKSFPWGEEGEIVRMINSLNTQDVPIINDLLEYLSHASDLLWILPNKQKRRSLWQHVKQTSIIDDSGSLKTISTFLSTATDFRLLRINMSLAWHDEELYQNSICEMTSFLVACSHHLSQCFDALPSSMKKEMNCVPLIDGLQIFPEYETARDYSFQEKLNYGLVGFMYARFWEENFIYSTPYDIYTGSNGKLRMFFIAFWEVLLDVDLSPFENYAPKYTIKELDIIYKFEEICNEKTKEVGSTDHSVALQISNIVSNLRTKILECEKRGWKRDDSDPS